MQILLNKLSNIFDPQTANDFVYPKTFETRHHLTIEELKNGAYNMSTIHTDCHNIKKTTR